MRIFIAAMQAWRTNQWGQWETSNRPGIGFYESEREAYEKMMKGYKETNPVSDGWRDHKIFIDEATDFVYEQLGMK